MEWKTDLRNDEVDGYLATERMIEGFGVGEERTSSEIWEALKSAAVGEVKLGLWNDVMEKEYPRRNYL